ncbi:hypothetical protein D3C87_1555460 [compost metagenome]
MIGDRFEAGTVAFITGQFFRRHFRLQWLGRCNTDRVFYLFCLYLNDYRHILQDVYFRLFSEGIVELL